MTRWSGPQDTAFTLYLCIYIYNIQNANIPYLLHFMLPDSGEIMIFFFSLVTSDAKRLKDARGQLL